MPPHKHTLLSSSMKMSDIIMDNYALLTVLQRFDIPLGMGEQTIEQICKKHGVNLEFFMLVCNVYTHAEYLPTNDEIITIDIESLICYLQKSHIYYLDEKISLIEKKLNSMNQSCDPAQSEIINKFFSEYKKEIQNHFRYEEKQVFPYIRTLKATQVRTEFNIHQYEENHSNIEDKLSDLKNIIIKYLPESCSSTLRNDVLFDIFLFEDDLIKHSLIEDKILVPYVSQIEQSYER